MKFLTTLQQKLGFTRNEAKVILFLSSTFLLGLAIRWYTSNVQKATSPGSEFNYSTSDSIFAERSKKIQIIDSLSGNQTAASEQKGSSSQPSLRPNSININTASKDQLMLLPGIGEGYAERIILYRDDNGPFSSVDELERVKGIGKKKLEKLKPFVTTK
jgi:comEA protein